MYQNTNPYAHYEFYVNEKKIEGATHLRGKIYEGWVGKYFEVKYSNKDPEINDILFNKPVYDTLLIKKAGFTIKKKKKKKRNQFQEF